MIGLFILVCSFVMHCMMRVMVMAMDDFFVMGGFMCLGHRHPCHSHEDQGG